MRVTVVIATCGDERWTDLAWSRAYPSADAARIGDPNVWTTEVILRHLPEGTVVQARNAAAADATGDWLCFLDADDELDRDYLVAMANVYAEAVSSCIECRGEGWVMDHEEACYVDGSCVCGGVQRPCVTCDGSGRALAVLVPAVSYVEREGDYGLAEIPNGGGMRPLIDINHAVIGSLVPRSLFLAVGGFRELAALEDWDLWLRCEEEGAAFVPVPGAIYRAWVSPGSRNSDQSLYHELRRETLARRSRP